MKAEWCLFISFVHFQKWFCKVTEVRPKNLSLPKKLWKPGDEGSSIFSTFKQLEISKSGSNMICTSPKSNKFAKFGWCGSKNVPPYAHFEFKMVLAGNPFWVQQGSQNLVKSWILMRSKNGEILVAISQTNFE